MNEDLKNFIEELQDTIEGCDLEERLEITLLIGESEDLLKEKCPVIFTTCSNCHGDAHWQLYEDVYDCRSCFGLGGKYIKWVKK